MPRRRAGVNHPGSRPESHPELGFDPGSPVFIVELGLWRIRARVKVTGAWLRPDRDLLHIVTAIQLFYVPYSSYIPVCYK